MQLKMALYGDLRKIIAEELDFAAHNVREAMAATGLELQNQLRHQVTASGLGQKLANAWRLNVYPSRPHINAAALVYSKASKLHEAYNTGGIIRAKNGSKYLAIPTEAVPTAAKGAAGVSIYATTGRRKMTPVEVEAHFNAELDFVPFRTGRSGGGWLVLRQAVLGKGKKSRLRQATEKRLKQGRGLTSAIMFTLIPFAGIKKRLDIEGAKKTATERLLYRLKRNLNTTS